MTREPNRLNMRSAAAAADTQVVKELRQVVYVDDRQHLDSTDQMADGFDRFSGATYLIACLGSRPVGAVKVVRDSAQGLA